MKPNILILIFCVVFLDSYSQTVFDKFENKEGVNAVLINKKMFQLMSNIKLDTSDPEMQQYLNLIKKLDELKVFTTSSALQTNDMKATAEDYAKNNHLEALINTIETKKILKIWSKKGNLINQYVEILMFKKENTNENESVLMNLKGSFEINELNVLMKKMNIQGAEEVRNLKNK